MTFPSDFLSATARPGVRSLRSILLTGGAGFIGSTLTRHLLARNDLEKLVVLDALTEVANRAHLSGPDQDPRFEFIEGDINDRQRVALLLRKTSCTGIFNLAAESHVDRSIKNPDAFIRTNIMGVSNLLEVARAADVPMLQCSTDEVYGAIPSPKRVDEAGKLRPSSPYSASKASADLLGRAAHHTHGQDVVIARCTNNYGPRQHREKLIPTLVYHALRDQPLPLYGSGRQIRDWIHVDDCALGLITTFEKGRSGQIYHLGAKTERTNLGIAREVLKHLQKPPTLISHVPDRPGHDARYALDPRRALIELGWRARIPFRSAIGNVIRELAQSLRSS